MSKTLLQRFEGFRAQGVLAGWAGDDGGAFSSGGGSSSVGGSYMGGRGFVVPSTVSTPGRVSEKKWRVRTHGWIEAGLESGSELAR
jgi:hypothetical protein